MDNSNQIDFLKSEIAELQSKLNSIQARNFKVESDKKWETSTTRFVCVAVTTYITMNLILWSIGGPFPPIHAIVPTCGYMLSTLSLPWIKKWWMAKEESKN